MMKTTLSLIVVLLLLVACKTKKEIISPTPNPPPKETIEPVQEAEEETLHLNSGLSSQGIDVGIISGDVANIRTPIFIKGVVQNQVTGKPIEKGEIYFVEEKSFEQLQFPIVNGKYEAALVSGCYLVEVYAPSLMKDKDQQKICISDVTGNSGDSRNKSYDFFPTEVRLAISTTDSGSGPDPLVRIDPVKEPVIEESKIEEETVAKTAPIDRPTTTASVTSEIPNINEVAVADMNRIATGQFRYDPIPPLPIDTVYLFELEIIPGQDSAKFTAVTGNETGRAIQKKIRIASEMSIHIVSPNKAFEINQVSDSVQVIDPISSTVWRWSVIPRELGKHPVIVSIDILTKGEETGETRKKSIEVFNEQVEVYVVAKEPIITAAEEKAFNWLYAIIPLALLLGGGLFFFFRKKQKEEKEQEWVIAPNAKVFLLEVENKIADGDTETAIKKLLEFFKESEKLHSELLQLSAQYQTFKQEELQGLEPPKKILNRINLAIIEMVNGLQSKLRHT